MVAYSSIGHMGYVCYAAAATYDLASVFQMISRTDLSAAVSAGRLFTKTGSRVI